MKDSFVLYIEYIDQLELLTMEQRGVLFTAIMHHSAGRALPDMDDVTKMAFAFIRADLDRNARKYEEKVEARRKAGEKGGRPKANAFSEKQTKAKKANAFSEKQNNPDSDSDSDSESVSVSDSESDSENGDVTPNGVITPHTPRGGKGQRAERNLELLGTVGATYGFSDPMFAKLSEWMRYKAESHKFVYEEMGAKSLFSQIKKYIDSCGEYAVMELIDESMSSGWKGIIWDKLNSQRGINWDNLNSQRGGATFMDMLRDECGGG